MMELVDLLIIIALLIFGVVGLKRGFFKQLVLTVGTILVFILAFIFKDYIADLLSFYLPFFKFTDVLPGLVTLNIILYQMIAFLILAGIFSAILSIINKITGLLEKILNATIIFGIPSKIGGFIVGAIEGYVVIFITLFFLNQPIINYKIINESKYMPEILNSSPILSNISKKMLDTTDEIYGLIKTYKKDGDVSKFNRESIDIMLKNKIVDVEYIDKLIEKDKINIKGIDKILADYR